MVQDTVIIHDGAMFGKDEQMSTPTRPSARMRVEFEIDPTWIKCAAAGIVILIGLGFLWLVLVILRAVLSAANEVVLVVQHATPALQLVVAAILAAGMLMIIMRLALAIWNEVRTRRGGAA